MKVSLSNCLLSYIDNRGVTPKKLKGEFINHPNGYRVLSANNVKSTGLVKTNEIRFVDKELYCKWMSEEISRGDILLTSEAPAGEIMYWDSDEKIVVGQRLYALRVNPKIVDSLYLSYYLKSYKGQAEIKKNITGSTVFGISQKTFDNITIDLPNLSTQKKIAKILKDIDDQIQRNNEMVQKLPSSGNTISCIFKNGGNAYVY